MKILKTIEGKRNSKNIFWRILVFIKDGAWVLTNFAKKAIFKFKAHIMLKRLDNHKIPKKVDEIRLFTSVRNNLLWLPNYFEYYRQLGVDRFFVIDNNSSDETLSFLKQQKNTHIFTTKQNFKESEYAISWLTILFKKYGIGKWCLFVDADEIFKYPNCDKINLKELCKFLDGENVNSLKTLMLDMYSDQPIKNSHYDNNYMKTFPFFERSHYLNKGKMVGGVRERVFGVTPFLDKHPLFKYNPKVKLLKVSHEVSGMKKSKVIGVLMHYKYCSDFISRVAEEVTRKQITLEEYGGYAKTLIKNPDLNLYHKKHSIKYKDPQQLVNMDIMHTTKEFEDYLNESRSRSRSQKV